MRGVFVVAMVVVEIGREMHTTDLGRGRNQFLFWIDIHDYHGQFDFRYRHRQQLNGGTGCENWIMGHDDHEL